MTTTTLTWKHHTLIQSLLSRGPIASVDFHKIFESVTGRHPVTNEKMFNDYLLSINKELSYVQFELRGCRNQYDGKVYYGVVNNVADEQSKIGTKYSVPQITFYKGIIEGIVQDFAGRGSISNIDALNIRLENLVPASTQSLLESQTGSQTGVPSAFRTFSMSQKEKTLEELIKDKWLCSTSDGRIGLGVRSLLDLQSWFHNSDVPSCHVCNEAAVKAEVCPNDSCTIRIHKYCLVKKYSLAKVDKVCPGCSSPWPYEATKAEILEYLDEPYEPPATQREGCPKGKKRIAEDAKNITTVRRKSLRRSVIADEVEDTPSTSSSPHPPSTHMSSNVRRSTRSAVRLR
ncbi:hypothetical protein Droror1_Dr00019173 [Drosera rotundifolia]